MRLMRLVIISSLAVVTAACATNRTDLAETGAVDVEIDGGPRSAARDVDVYYDDEDAETIIRGKVFSTGVYPWYGEHVDITVISPDGQVIAEERPGLVWGTRSLKSLRRRTGVGRFTVRLPQAVPSGTVVQVVYHGISHPNANSAG